MISKQEALDHLRMVLELKLESLEYWCSINGVSESDRRAAQQLEIRLGCLDRGMVSKDTVCEVCVGTSQA